VHHRQQCQPQGVKNHESYDHAPLLLRLRLRRVHPQSPGHALRRQENKATHEAPTKNNKARGALQLVGPGAFPPYPSIRQVLLQRHWPQRQLKFP
jgi:hypothetical protein